MRFNEFCGHKTVDTLLRPAVESMAHFEFHHQCESGDEGPSLSVVGARTIRTHHGDLAAVDATKRVPSDPVDLDGGRGSALR